MPDALLPALFGACGALIYAAPRFTACLFTAKETRGHVARCFSEAVVSLTVGSVAAACFGTFIAHLIHQTGEGSIPAVCALIGALANTAAPGLINAISGRLVAKAQTTDTGVPNP